MHIYNTSSGTRAHGRSLVDWGWERIQGVPEVLHREKPPDLLGSFDRRDLGSIRRFDDVWLCSFYYYSAVYM